MNHYDRLYKILEYMIIFSKDIREERLNDERDNRNILNLIGGKHWLKEFCVIKFGLSRQSGHTINSLKLIDEYFKNPLYISKYDSTKSFSKGFYSMDGELLLKVSENIKPATYNNFENKIRGSNIDVVLVDTATFFSKQKEELLFDICTPLIKFNPMFTIIFVQ